MSIVQIFQLLVGPAGRFLRGLWEPDEVLANLLWSADVTVSRVVAVQIINGKRPLSKKHIRPYLTHDGLALLQEDLCAFVSYYHSHAMLIDICNRIHMAVSVSGWSQDQIASLDEYHIVDTPSRDQIAIYIARVMYTIICS